VGFSPSQPTNASWCPPGERKRVPYENPQGRRLNVLAGLVADGPLPALTWWPHARSITADDLLTFLREAFPDHPRPLVVVLDNASTHTSRAVKGADLAAEGIVLEHLPAYSPELNRIEPLFGAIKHHDLPERSYTTMADLDAAVRAAFQRAEQRLLARDTTSRQLRPAA